MKNFGKQHCARHRRSRGFTWIELMMVAFVILVTTTISLPSFIQAYQHYQVDDAAARMANVIKFTRYEAIRRNAPVSFGIGVTAAATTVAWTDSNGNGATAGMAGANAADATERQVAFSPNVTLFAAGNVPNTAGLILAAGVGPLIPLSNTNAVVQFDQRGAVNPPPAGALVSYVGSIGLPNAGYRAVILLPSGSIQVWQASRVGTVASNTWVWNYLH